MAVVSGTSAGFVSSQPINDPVGDAGYDDKGNYIMGVQDTSPAGTNSVTDMGWWVETTGEDGNFEVGIYSNDDTGPDPNVLLASNTTNSKGTTAGWKRSTVSYGLTENTPYWICVQVDDTITAIKPNYSTETGTYAVNVDSKTTLPAEWPGAGTNSNTAFAVYALYSAAGGDPEGSLIGGKLLRGGLLTHGVLVRG